MDGLVTHRDTHAHTAADLQRLIPRLARHEHQVHQIIIKSRELMASLAREAAAAAPPPSRERVVDAAIAVLRENKGTATVAATAMGVYRADARFKDFVKNQLGTTMLDLLLQHPQYFELHHSRNVVALSTPPSVGSAQEVYMTDEVASHNHKPDECMVVNGDVVHAQPRAQLTLIKGVCVCVCVCVCRHQFEERAKS